MYLRESRQKRADGSTLTHLQFAESVWNAARGQSEIRIVYSWGRSDDPAVLDRLRALARSILRRVSPEEIVAQDGAWKRVNAWPYGDLYALQALWERLGIAEVISEQAGERRFGFSLERALFAMVANRACAPCSKLYCYEQWLREDVQIEGTQTLQLQNLYRAMDFLEENKEAMERAIFFRVADLLNLDVDVVFYDTTSLHVETDAEDVGEGEDDQVKGSATAGGKLYPAPRKRGYSKNGRTDVPQIVVGMALTRDGFPVRHWVFPGNTVDVTTVEKVKADLRDWKLGRCLFVGDAGMVSAANLKVLSRGGGKYLLCMPMRRGDEVTEQVIGRPGRYQVLAENLQVKEVVVGEGERRRRYALCYNPQEALRQKAHRAQILEQLEAELGSLKGGDEDSHSKRVCALRASARYGRYLKLDGKERLSIDTARVAQAERFDGKFVVHSNDDTLSAADMALGYKQQQRVEEAWRTLKGALRMRPMFHWAVHRIHAQVSLTVLALLLERTAERACEDTWRNIRDDLKGVKLAQLFSPNGTVWQVTEPSPEAAKRLKSLNIKAPAPILRLA